jgi:2-polyprenyl-3-methyl-5-hydroxy-6-metoxy-1,4-benzoquinol methylase
MPLPSALSRQSIRRRAYQLNFALKPRHRARFRTLDVDKAKRLAEFTTAHYTERVTDEGDLDAALAGALIEDRYANVPWLDAAYPLDGARILEIGCGTGESTLALAEQGAVVTGLDVDEAALSVGRERLKLYGLEADLRLGNAANVASELPGQTFDMVIFFASLEHMTLQERFAAMEQTWGMLKPGGVWVVVEAPNRLWFWDGHTSMENFYNWLPDELAAR